MSDMTLLRIGIAVAMSLLFGAIIYFGRGRRNAQGRRVPREGTSGGEARTEPSLGDQFTDGWNSSPAQQEELALDGSPAQSELGKRVSEQFDRIVSLYVAAKARQGMRATDRRALLGRHVRPLDRPRLAGSRLRWRHCSHRTGRYRSHPYSCPHH